VFRGSKNNVLKRYYHAARKNKSDVIIRITSDCPLTDPKIVNKMIDKFKNIKTDYLSNINPPSFPDGLDAEVFTFKALQKCYLLAKNRYDLEHVTPFFRNSGKFKIDNYKSKNNFSNLRLTIDQPEDLILVKKIAKKFATKPKFNIDDIIRIYKKDPELFEINKHIKRNEGSETLNSQQLWRKAKKIIPGGNMLVSKRPELFLPGRWPVYYKKAKGCKVWDIDDNCYFDFSFMGVGTNILGYSNNFINDHVNSAIEKSNVSSLNCVEEVKLAEKLIKLHPWSDMIKFARTGGEANSIAVRIARAASGKDKIAFCGYHGWHDWYLSANLSNSKNLNKQLFSNLSINGVPKSLKNTAFPFEFNDFKKLVEITKKHDIGVIKMEVFRNVKPKNDFLKKIRNLATKKNIILIFDECTSGFRENFGGLHLKYGVAPDIAIFGKALGNGHAITAVLGKKEIKLEHYF
jgi:glutamate-1-semialdehyde 2,1-aminomutase